jgi:hypothetical protein
LDLALYSIVSSSLRAAQAKILGEQWHYAKASSQDIVFVQKMMFLMSVETNCKNVQRKSRSRDTMNVQS